MSETTAKTITLVNKATKALVKASTDLSKTMTDLTSLIATSEEVSSEIEFKSSELANIKSQIHNEFRTAKAELQISILENEDKVLADLMSNRNFATITQEDLESLQEAHASATADNATAIDKAVAVAVQSATTKHNYAQRDLEAKHEVETAKLKADADALANEINFLKHALTDSQETLKAEREARIAIAASDSQKSGVVVNTTGK